MSENRNVCVFLRANFVSFLVLVFRLLFYTRKKVGAGQGSVSDFFLFTVCVHVSFSCSGYMRGKRSWDGQEWKLNDFDACIFLLFTLMRAGLSSSFLIPIAI